MEDGKKMSNLKILYEDNHIIVVVKPFNVLSQGDNTGDSSIMDMIKDYIKIKYNKPGNVYLGLVHRLDRPVGGIMVFARTSKAASRLSRDFNDHSIDKKYLAIVKGKVSDSGEFIDKIDRNKNGNSFIFENGKYAKLQEDIICWVIKDMVFKIINKYVCFHIIYLLHIQLLRRRWNFLICHLKLVIGHFLHCQKMYRL